MRFRSVLLPGALSLVALAGCASDDERPAEPPITTPERSGPSGPGAPEGGTSPPPPPQFQQGEAFDYAQIGTTRSQMVEAMIEGLGYVSSTAPKAIAINKLGLGFVSVKPGATQEDAERTAKEACFVIGGGGPCHLLASGNVFAISHTSLTNDAEGFVLQGPTTLGPVPFMAAAAAAAEVRDYQAIGAKPRALAVGLDGVAARAPSKATSLAAGNDADASRTALERCEMMSGFTPCTLYAVGDTVVFDPAKPNWTPQIDYARRTVSQNIPGSVQAAYTSYIGPEYVTSVSGGTPGAIYISRDGAGGYRMAASGADAAALGECNKNRPSTEPCFRYATNLNVVFRPTDLHSLSKGSTKTHCLAMPRVNCAAHLAIGCAAGRYYTTTWGIPALETCN